MPVPKTGALPLGDVPNFVGRNITIFILRIKHKYALAPHDFFAYVEIEYLRGCSSMVEQ